MSRILISPQKFVLGAGELTRLSAHVAPFGARLLLIAAAEDRERVDNDLQAAIRDGLEVVEVVFGGEITIVEIERIEGIAREHNCDAIAGLGGGKALDTAKVVADRLRRPCIVIPTIASTDAPCSALAVIYSQEGAFESGIIVSRNPDLVLVDSAIIARAPTRFLVSGMGDALATYFEARSCTRADGKNVSGGSTTMAAQALARACNDILMADSLKAKAACEAGVVTTALENVIEANILLSGLGFESGGLGAAHSIHNGLTQLPETHPMMHGEKVAFGVIVQLVLENADTSEINSVLDYLRAVGLPTNLADLGVESNDERIQIIAEASVLPGETIHNMPFAVDANSVAAAINVADILGQ